jgi:hypothetical protein
MAEAVGFMLLCLHAATEYECCDCETENRLHGLSLV